MEPAGASTSIHVVYANDVVWQKLVVEYHVVIFQVGGLLVLARLNEGKAELGKLLVRHIKTRLDALDEATLADLSRLFGEAAALTPVRKADAALGWQASLYDAITVLTSQIRAAGLSSDLRRRMDHKLLADRPFKQLARASEQLLEAIRRDVRPDTIQLHGSETAGRVAEIGRRR